MDLNKYCYIQMNFRSVANSLHRDIADEMYRVRKNLKELLDQENYKFIQLFDDDFCIIPKSVKMINVDCDSHISAIIGKQGSNISRVKVLHNLKKLHIKDIRENKERCVEIWKLSIELYKEVNSIINENIEFAAEIEFDLKN